MRKEESYKRQCARACLLVPLLCCAMSSPLAATLDSKTASALVSGRTWQLKKPRGPGYDYWSWNADGSLCMRLGEKTGNCADTGRWKLEGERLCYELTWWGAETKMKSACFRVSDLGKDHYGALQDNGLNLFEFSPVK